jgi:hypothetical protein
MDICDHRDVDPFDTGVFSIAAANGDLLDQ